MDRTFFSIGSFWAFLAVALGAFGAHGLKNRLSPEMLGIFETAVRYQLVHALALLGVAWAITRWPGSQVAVSGWLLLAGSIVFSGSLYLLSLTGLKWLGAITPIGGVALLVGWLLLAWAAWH